MGQVKRIRRYRAPIRQAQAARTRAAVLDAAEQLFFGRGYAGTTVASVAAEAGVSPETIYKSFGGKSGVVRALHARSLAGRGPVAAYERSDEAQRMATDPRVLLRQWGSLAAEVAPLVAPVLLLVRLAAAADPEMAALQEDIDTERLTRMRHNAATLAEHGWLRPGVDADRAADVLWTCTAPDLYEALVLRRGWSPEQYGTFIADTLGATLLPP